jgi:DNA topoisomerase VI subunit A
MKKNEVKKLRLSRETLHTLQDSDSRKVMGGTDDPSGDQNMSCQSAGECGCGRPPTVSE